MVPAQIHIAAGAMDDKKRTVLICDDLMFNRMVMGKIFRKLGFSVLEAEDGAQAVEHFNRQHCGVDLIMMDLVMPVLDGYGASQALRRIEQTLQLPRCPIVACTAEISNTSTDPEHLAQSHTVITACHASGMDHVVGKPVSLELMEHLVRRFVPSYEAAFGSGPPTTTTMRFALNAELTDKLNDRARALLSVSSAENVEDAQLRETRRASFDSRPGRPRSSLRSLSSHSAQLYLPALKAAGITPQSWPPNMADGSPARVQPPAVL